MLEIGGWFAINRNPLAAAGVYEFKMRGVKCDARYQLFSGFRAMVLSVADDGMAYCRELGADLVLQAGFQFNSHQVASANRRSTV